jgi:excisionase family DNA binding protein
VVVNNEQTPELGPGERPSTFLVGEPDSSGSTVSISEAARRLGVSVSTVRRRLKAGEIPGAHKAPGPDGEEYRIPVASLPEPSTGRPVTSLEDDLRRQLDEERRARELAEALLESERRGRDELARTVEVLRESIEALNRALPPAPVVIEQKSGRWWKRSKKQGPTTP